MGLSEEELVAPLSVSETLKCPVCFDIFDDPVFCGGRPCQHVFCRACLEQALVASGQCPTCRADVEHEDLQPHQAIRNLLDEVVVRCERSCGWTGRRDARSAHADVCPVAALEAAKAELDGLSDIRGQLAARDVRIADLEKRVAEQDDHVVSVSRQLVAREVRIKELEARLASQELLLAERESEFDSLRSRGAAQGCSLESSGMLPSHPNSLHDGLAEADGGGGTDLWL